MAGFLLQRSLPSDEELEFRIALAHAGSPFSYREPAYSIGMLGVPGSHRRRGIGRLLVQRVMDDAALEKRQLYAMCWRGDDWGIAAAVPISRFHPPADAGRPRTATARALCSWVVRDLGFHGRRI